MTAVAEGTPTSPTFHLDGRLAVVMGASEGIGRSLAFAYAQAGARQILVSRAPSHLRPWPSP